MSLLNLCWKSLTSCVALTGTPSKFDLKGNTEIAGASLEYRRKPDAR